MSRAVVVIAVMLAACDFLYGVNRRAALTRLPQVDCVRDVLEATPGVDRVEYDAHVGARPITWTGLRSADQVHTFVFRGDGVWGAVQFIVSYEGRLDFSDTCLELNRKPPQELIDRTRPVMKALEASLERRCDVAGLVESVHETCLGVVCEAP